MTRYRMRVFKPGREPELWQTHDLLADNDDDAMRQAEALFQQLREELATARAPHSPTHFSLTEGGRLLYMSPRRDW